MIQSGENNLKFKIILISILSLLSYLPALAQVVDDIDVPKSVKKELSEIIKMELLKELRELSTESVAKIDHRLEEYNRKVLFYIQQRDKECKGEFSSVEIDEKGESEVVKRKLSKTEKKLCLLDLVNFRKEYINKIFLARSKALKAKQLKQIKNLEQIRISTIKKLDAIAVKLSK